MNEAELAILLAADDPVAREHPPGFDWPGAMEEVRRLKPELERVAGRAFDLDDRVQDASFFAELAVRRRAGRVVLTVFGVYFSCFGRLFTDWASEAAERLPDETARAIIDRIEAAGFVGVSRDALSLPYSGKNPAFHGLTWERRFFDYL